MTGKIYYKIHKDTIMLADLFYERHLKDSRFLNATNQFLKQINITAISRKNLAMHFFDMLNDIHLLNELVDAPKKILMLDLQPNKFFIEEAFKNEKNLDIRWISSKLFFAFLFIGYFGYLLIKVFRSGFIF